MRIVKLVVLFSFIACSTKGQITLEDLYGKYTFSPKGIEQMRSVGDGFYTTLNKKKGVLLRKYSDRNFEKVLLDKLVVNGKKIKISNYKLSENRQKLLLITDVEPIYRHSYKADCYVDIIAGHKAASPPSLEDVKKEIKKQGYSEDLLFPDEEIKALLEQGCRSGGAQSFCLSRDREGSFNIDINSAQTEAYLQMSKGRGKGKALNIKEAWKHVQTLNIKGLDMSRLKEEIVNFNKSDKMDIRILLAKGEEPQRGEDRRLEVEAVYLNEEETQKIQGRLKEGMSSSFREFPIDKIQKMALVEKGQSLFHLQEQTEGKEGRDIFGNVIKGIEGNDPVLQVYENINILEGKGKSRITGILDYCWEGNVYFLRVREHQDARVMVSVAENHMSASVSFLPPQGSGSPVREGLLREALKKKGVVSGLLEEEILRACVLAQEGKIATEHLVAEARIPFKGGGALKFLVGLEPGKKNRVSVEAGCFVAAFAESDEGTPCNVLGEPFLLEAEEGIEAGENLVQEEKEGLRFLKARATGMLCLEKGRLIVKDRKKISGDVSRAMGNVQFPGSIQIAGSVLSGIFIKAGKNLQVHEVVEASLLSAGGSIQVGKGIKGEGKAVLRAGEQIALGFAEQTNLMANGKVKVKKYLMNCMVKCNAEIQGADRRSKILGGTIKVKHGLAVGSLGSKAEMETRISFGQDYLVEDRIRVVDREIEEMHRQLSLMESSLKEAEQKKQQNKLMAYRKKKVEMLKILEKKGIKKFFLQEKFEIHFDSEIKVWETLHPGVIFESHGRSLLIKETHEGVRVYFDQNTGKIKIKNLMSNDQK